MVKEKFVIDSRITQKRQNRKKELCTRDKGRTFENDSVKIANCFLAGSGTLRGTVQFKFKGTVGKKAVRRRIQLKFGT